MPIFKGFSVSDFTNKWDFNTKINGKGEPNGYVLTTDGVQSYWQPSGGGGTGYQGVQGIQGPSGGGGGGLGIQGVQGLQGGYGLQGIQGPSGSGGSGSYYYQFHYADLDYYDTPIEVNSQSDIYYNGSTCYTQYEDQFDENSKNQVINFEYRDSTLTPVTTTYNSGRMVVDERSPFSFGTCYVDVYADTGVLNGVELGVENVLPVVYWKPNSTSRSYTYYKDGETGGGVGGLGSYTQRGSAIKDLFPEHDWWDGYPFVLGIDLNFTDSEIDGINYEFSRASQTDHYLLIDNQGIGDAVNLKCIKIFIKDVIQIVGEVPGLPLQNQPNFIFDPYKNVKFTSMNNNFVVMEQSMVLLHLCIRRFPSFDPLNLNDATYINQYSSLEGDPYVRRETCDTLIVSLDWTYYNSRLEMLSDTKSSNEIPYQMQPGGFVIDGNIYCIE